MQTKIGWKIKIYATITSCFELIFRHEIKCFSNHIMIISGPLQPVTLTADATSSSTVSLTWTVDSEGTQESFEITYSGQAVDQASRSETGIPSDTRTKTIPDLRPGERYTYVIKAISGDQQSSTRQTEKVQGRG